MEVFYNERRRHSALGGVSSGPHDYEIHFKGDRLAELRINAPGIGASGTLSVAADAGGSLVEYQLRIHVGRVAG